MANAGEPSVDPDDLPTGTLLADGRFTIEARLGRGGVATVYRVRTTDGRVLALKLMGTRRSADGDQRERFDNEWRLLRALRGAPYVARVEGNGRHDDGRPWFSMELLSDPTLTEMLGQRGMPAARACAIARDVADVLADLHARGVVHRDIKPDNIMVGPGGIHLLDFGYAHTEGSDVLPTIAGLTAVEHRPGTPLYMAPEQVEGTKVSPSFDVYGLAVTLYEALVGHAPNSERPVPEMMAIKCLRRFDELSIKGRVYGLDDRVVELVDRGLRRDTTERIASAANFRDGLAEVLAELGEHQSPAREADDDDPTNQVVGETRGATEVVPRATTVTQLSVAGAATQADVSTERAPRVGPVRPMLGGGRGDTAPVPEAEVVPPPVPPPSALDAAVHAIREADEADRAFKAFELPPETKHAMANDLTISVPIEYGHAAVDASDKRKRAKAAVMELAVEVQRSTEPERSAQEQQDRVAVINEAVRAAEQQHEQARFKLRTALVAVGTVAVVLLAVLAWQMRVDHGEAQGDRAVVDSEPSKAPEALVTPEAEPRPVADEPRPVVEVEPEVAPPEPEVVPPEPEPEVAPPEPEPEPEVAPKRPRSKPTPKGETEPAPPCGDMEAKTRDALRSRQLRSVLTLTQSSRCWTDDAARIRFRVGALVELGRFEECARFQTTTDPEARRLAKRCAKQLDEETAP